MNLIKKCACAVAKDVALCLEGEIRHAPKCVANTFLDVWKQTLVISIKCGSRLCKNIIFLSWQKNIIFLSWHNTVYGFSACGIFMRLGD